MAQNRLRFPIGLSDFRQLREDGFVYVDKSALIFDVLDDDAQVLLAPRPRRFGKTLGLSMLRCFFEKREEDLRPLFTGLRIASNEAAWKHFQRYPVIFMTFKDVKPRSWEECFEGMQLVLAAVYQEHRYLLDANLTPEDGALFTTILGRRSTKSELAIALKLLSRLLNEHHDERVVILVDEYDSPIHAGYTNGYYDDIVSFFRDFLSGGLKDNPHLWKGVLTGILRVARESMFSGLNNIEVFSLLRPDLATAFGFTDTEVRSLAEAAGQAEDIEGIRAFYNGYWFGGHAIYNPWSVLCYLKRGDRVLRPYWIETSSNDLVRELLLSGPKDAGTDLETVLQGGEIRKAINEHIVLRDIAHRSDALWSFLLFTGYLKAVEVRYEETECWCKLAVPNAEVSLALRGMARDWLEARAGGNEGLRAFLDAVLRGDAEGMEGRLGHMLEVNVSFHDTAQEPERFYHGLIVGMLAGLGGHHEVRSNRESGFGRCDVMILPKTPGQPGVVLELKTVDRNRGETPKKALSAAFRQLRERDYATELRERGADPIHELAAVFDGKRVSVRHVPTEKRRAIQKTVKKHGA